MLSLQQTVCQCRHRSYRRAGYGTEDSRRKKGMPSTKQATPPTLIHRGKAMKSMDRPDGSSLCVCGAAEGEPVEVARNTESRMTWQQGSRGKKEWDRLCHDWGCGETGDGGCRRTGGGEMLSLLLPLLLAGTQDIRLQNCFFQGVRLSRLGQAGLLCCQE